MRTVVDLAKGDLELLDRIAKSENISRAEVVRRAIFWYLAQHKTEASGIDAAFGLWASRGEDGLIYQEQIRNEWER